MNFNLSELENLFEQIKEIIDFMEHSRYENRRYKLFLGNDERFTFYIPKESIAHLLGINTTYLTTTSRFNSTNSFELLKELCEYPYRIYSMIRDKQLDPDKLFSPYILSKVEGFRENIKITFEEIEFVCKYDKSRAYLTDQFPENYDYIIVKKYDNGKIGILGIVRKNNEYVPMSNQLFDSFDEAKEKLDKYLRNQEVTIINAINTFNTETDYDKTCYLPLNEKLRKIKNIKGYKPLFNFSIDLSGDYKHSIMRLKSNRDSYSEDNDIIDIIVKSIKEGKLIDANIAGDSNLIRIIDGFNDYLCSNPISANSTPSETYTELKKDLEYFKNELIKAQERIGVLESENNSLTESVATLTEENNEHKETEGKILELLNRKPRM